VGTRPEKIRIQKWYTVFKVRLAPGHKQDLILTTDCRCVRGLTALLSTKLPSDFACPIFQDHITLEDYEIHDGMGLEMYYN